MERNDQRWATLFLRAGAELNSLDVVLIVFVSRTTRRAVRAIEPIGEQCACKGDRLATELLHR